MSFFSKYSILSGGGSGGVTSVNTLEGALTLAAGTGITITPSGGDTLTISAPQVGTVTSVAMTVPSIMSVAGSPITSTGTLAVTLATQTANTVFAGPTTGGAATPAFRALVAADIPATINSTILTSDGAAGTPSYSFSSDTNTGMFLLAPDVLSLSTGGVNRLAISTTDINFAAGMTTNYLSGTAVAKFWNTGGTFGATLRGNAAQSANTTFQLPIDNGTSGYVLSTNGSGITSWVEGSSFDPLAANIPFLPDEQVALTSNQTSVFWGGPIDGLMFDSTALINDGNQNEYGFIATSDRAGGKTANLQIQTGNATTTGNTGALFVQIGEATAGAGGIIQLQAGNGTTSGGGVQIYGGNASAGNSQNIELTTGTASGTRGSIVMDATSVTASGYASFKTSDDYTSVWSGDVPGLEIDGASAVANSAGGAGLLFKGDAGGANYLFIMTNDSADGDSSPPVFEATGNNTGTGDTGSREVKTGNALGVTGNSGQWTETTGNSAGGNSGLRSILTGDASTGDTGDITFTTGSAGVNSGSFNFTTGTAGGTRGNITLNALNVDIESEIIGGTTGAANWRIRPRSTTSTTDANTLFLEGGNSVTGAAGFSHVQGGSTVDGIAGDAVVQGGVASDAAGSPGWATMAGGPSNFAAVDGGSVIVSSGGNSDGGLPGDVTLRTGTGTQGSIILDDSLSLLKLVVPATITAGATTGDQEINKISGTVNIAATGTSITVTNSLVSSTSIVFAVVRTNDTTAIIKNVTPTSGAFTIRTTAAVTAETSIGFFVLN